MIVFTAAFAAGIGAAISLGYLWHTTHKPKPWETRAIVASFVSADELDSTDANGTPIGGGMFWLRYALENRTDYDYTLSQNEKPIFMVRRGANFFPDDGSIHLPIFIPAKHRVVVTVQRSFSSDVVVRGANVSPPKAVRVVPGLDQTSSKLFHDNFDDISGLALFDSSHRYRIDLPRAW